MASRRRHEASPFIDQPLPVAYADTRDYAEAALKVGSDEEICGLISQKNTIVGSIGPFTVLWLVLGISTAFQLALNRRLEY